MAITNAELLKIFKDIGQVMVWAAPTTGKVAVLVPKLEKQTMTLVDQAISGLASEYDLYHLVVKAHAEAVDRIVSTWGSGLSSYFGTLVRQYFLTYAGPVLLETAAGATIDEIGTALAAAMTTCSKTVLTGGAYDTYLADTFGWALPKVANGNTIDEAWATSWLS